MCRTGSSLHRWGEETCKSFGTYFRLRLISSQPLPPSIRQNAVGACVLPQTASFMRLEMEAVAPLAPLVGVWRPKRGSEEMPHPFTIHPIYRYYPSCPFKVHPVDLSLLSLLSLISLVFKQSASVSKRVLADLRMSKCGMEVPLQCGAMREAAICCEAMPIMPKRPPMAGQAANLAKHGLQPRGKRDLRATTFRIGLLDTGYWILNTSNALALANGKIVFLCVGRARGFTAAC